MSSIEKVTDYRTESGASEERRADIPESLAGKRIDQALAIMFPDFSRSRLQQWIKEGHVQIAGARCEASRKVIGGESVLLRCQAGADEQAFRPEDIPLDVVHEDAALLVVDKPPGLVVHPGSGNWGGTLLNALLRHSPSNASLPRAGIVHRLDKDTSGLLVVAKTLPAHTELVRQLQARSIRREYFALVHGRVEADGMVDAPIGRHPRDRKRMAVVAKGKPAKTHYTIVEHGPGWTALTCRLETGRTHQIRVHLSSIGHALLGDPVYKVRSSFAGLPEAARSFQRQALHAQALGLEHPESRRPMQWHSSLPPDLVSLLERIRDA